MGAMVNCHNDSRGFGVPTRLVPERVETWVEPALHLRNTCLKSPFSPNCAIAPPHRPPNNGRTA